MMNKYLNFQNHSKLIVKTANQKLSALIRVAPFMSDFNKKVMWLCFIPLLKGSSIIAPSSGCLALELKP